MKRFMYFMIMSTVFISSIIYGQDKKSMEKMKELIFEVKTKYAPDKRVAIFNIELKEIDGQLIITGETNLKKAKSELLNSLINLDKTIKDEITVLPSTVLGKKHYGVINLSVANLRVAPEHSAEMATQALLGTAVRVFDKKDGWYLLQTPDNYIAWVDNDGVALKTLDEVNEWITAKKIIYTNEFGFVYSETDKQSFRVSDIVLGNILKYLGIDGSFTKVEYADGRIGYIESENCIDLEEWLKNTEPTQEKIISTAKKFNGLPYLWGGTSAKALDCSGFSKTVYFMNGVLLKRDASQQVLTGIEVDTKNGFDNCQPGDLLFFGRKSTDNKPEKITHVAIYLGNLDFIHSAGIISIDSFDKNKPNYNEYRLNAFIRAKRILTSLDKNEIFMLKNIDIYKGEKFNENE
ncbi:MAG: C40 family peptidase [bacterium]